MKTRTAISDFEPWELEAFAEGVDMPDVAAFTKKNPAIWAAWLTKYQQAEQRYITLQRFDCPSPDTLRDYYWDELTSTEYQRITAHLQTCFSCTKELQSLTDSLAEQTLAPPKTLASMLPAFNLGERFQEFSEQMRLLVAELVTPLNPLLVSSALRSDSTSGLDRERPTTLIFEAEEIDISLVIQKENDDRLTVSGQILTPVDGSTCKLKITNVDAAIDEQQLFVDKIGAFQVNHLRPGKYRFVFLLLNTSIVIPNITLQ